MPCRLLRGRSLGTLEEPFVAVPHAKTLRNLKSLCIFAGLITDHNDEDDRLFRHSYLFVHIPEGLLLRRLMLAGYDVRVTFQDGCAAFKRLEEYRVLGKHIIFGCAHPGSVRRTLLRRGLGIT